MNNEYLDKIRNGDMETIRSLYQGKVYLSLKKFVIQNGGSHVDVQEIFADALVILIKKLQDEDFVLTSKLENYIYGIGKNLWRSKLRKKTLSNVDISKVEEESHDNLQILGNELIEKEEEEILNKAMAESLKEIHENCQSILNAILFREKKYGFNSRGIGV